jgi:hypothetical protein
MIIHEKILYIFMKLTSSIQCELTQYSHLFIITSDGKSKAKLNKHINIFIIIQYFLTLAIYMTNKKIIPLVKKHLFL